MTDNPHLQYGRRPGTGSESAMAISGFPSTTPYIGYDRCRRHCKRRSHDTALPEEEGLADDVHLRRPHPRTGVSGSPHPRIHVGDHIPSPGRRCDRGHSGLRQEDDRLRLPEPRPCRNQLRSGGPHSIRAFTHPEGEAVQADREMVPPGSGFVLRGLAHHALHQRRLSDTAVLQQDHNPGHQGPGDRHMGPLQDNIERVRMDRRDCRRNDRPARLDIIHHVARHPVYQEDAVVRRCRQRRDARGTRGHAHNPRL